MKEYNKVLSYIIDEYVLRENSKRRENPCIFLVSLKTCGERRYLGF